MKILYKTYKPITHCLLLLIAGCGNIDTKQNTDNATLQITKITTKEEAVKFLESHEWDVNKCIMKYSDGSTIDMSTACEFVFANGMVTLWDKPCIYTIMDVPVNDGNHRFVIKFYDPKNGGNEMFYLGENGAATCEPATGETGVMAIFFGNIIK